jgi:exosortase A-associated hydrolase 1
MRRLLSFSCAGNTLWATLDDAQGAAGVLIVSGGNEIRSGAHGGMARLGADLAAAGVPTFRYDRRGVGDSDGINAGFEGSADDLAAALAAFKAACPTLSRIIAFGNCDAATALILHRPAGLDGMLLSNIWIVESSDDAMPPPAAIKAHYLARLKDPKAWRALFSGAINLRKLVHGLLKVSKGSAPSGLAARVAQAFDAGLPPIQILLCVRDGTAIAFADAWKQEMFAAARARTPVTQLDSASHSFASDADHQALLDALLEMIRA